MYLQNKRLWTKTRLSKVFSEKEKMCSIMQWPTLIKISGRKYPWHCRATKDCNGLQCCKTQWEHAGKTYGEACKFSPSLQFFRLAVRKRVVIKRLIYDRRLSVLLLWAYILYMQLALRFKHEVLVDTLAGANKTISVKVFEVLEDWSVLDVNIVHIYVSLNTLSSAKNYCLGTVC